MLSLVSSFISVEDQALRHQSQVDNIFTGASYFLQLQVQLYTKTVFRFWQYPLPVVGHCHCQPDTPPETLSAPRGISRAQVPQRKPSSSRAKCKLQYALEHLQQNTPYPPLATTTKLGSNLHIRLIVTLETIMVAMMQLVIPTMIPTNYLWPTTITRSPVCNLSKADCALSRGAFRLDGCWEN